jgi:hypothetical protein
MDARLFRLPTKPNFYAGIGQADPFDIERRQKYSQIPSPDNRYPGWAAPGESGRLVTSYQNNCSQNVPAGKQFATKKWMTNNATELIDVNRKRSAVFTGAIYGLDESIVPPPATTVEYSRSGVVRTPTNMEGGIGVERAPSVLPELFGTWDPRIPIVRPKPNVALTTHYEGGRNTPRGVELK